MKYVKINSIRNVDPGNPVLLSYLKHNLTLDIVYLKKYGSPTILLVHKNNEEIFKSIGIETGEEIEFSGKGKKLSIRGDHRQIDFPDKNIGDRILEILNNEDHGYIEIKIKRHYFATPNKGKASNKIDESRKNNLREGWKLKIETNNPSLKNYISHLFSNNKISVTFRKWIQNPPTIAWWEISYFLPTRILMRTEIGIKIGNTIKSGPIIIDPNKEFHSLVIGSTGSGKSTLVFNTIKNILKTKSGKVILIDPHGDTAYKLSKTEYNLFEISGESNGINILHNYNDKNINFRIAEDFVSILKSTREMQFSESFIGPRIEDLISRGIVAISNIQGATIVDLYNIFKSQESRNKILKSNENDELKKFIEEIESLPKEEIAGTERALGRLALDPFIRSLICNPKDDGIMDKEIDKNELILINLERGSLGYEDSRILSNILAVYIWFIISSKRNSNYYLFLEEAQDYQSKFISDMVSTGRKFGLRIFFITTSFKVISSNLEALFFSNISNYIVMKLSEPDRVDFEKFIGFPVDFPDEQLKFTLISSNTQIKGYTDKVLFEPHKSKFKESKYNFLTETENDNELFTKISEILSTFESRNKTFFIYETFANYLSSYEKSKVISNLKKILKDNQNVQYIGRFNLDFQRISGRYEVFLFTGTSSAAIKQSKIPRLFEIYSDYIESLIVTK